jgi:hypothetical protein
MIIAFVIVFLIGLAVGYNMTKTPKIDYKQVDEKLRKELYIAKNLNESLTKDKNELLEILDGMRGKKCLVMDAQLSSLLNMVVLEGSKLLKDSGVNFFRELKGEYLGDLTDEIDPKDGNYIVEFVSAGPKNYAYKTDKGVTKCTIKGFTLN